jgi:hypothetical protein
MTSPANDMLAGLDELANTILFTDHGEPEDLARSFANQFRDLNAYLTAGGELPGRWNHGLLSVIGYRVGETLDRLVLDKTKTEYTTQQEDDKSEEAASVSDAQPEEQRD